MKLQVAESTQLCKCSHDTWPVDCVDVSIQRMHQDLAEALISCEGSNQKSIAERQCLGISTETD